MAGSCCASPHIGTNALRKDLKMNKMGKETGQKEKAITQKNKVGERKKQRRTNRQERKRTK
jgi:hypothetical protein